MIRQLSPIDLPYLTSIRSMLSYDEACPRDNLGVSLRAVTAMEVFLGQWVIIRVGQRQQSWICAGEEGLQGFASIRSRAGSSTWEIDHLLLTRKNKHIVCGDLLQAIVRDSRNWSVQRIFLRLAAGNLSLNNLCQTGFTPYLHERLYQLNTRWHDNKKKKTSSLIIRPVNKNDEYRIFELYNTVFPAPVRRIEGITLGDWQEIRGSLSCQQCKKQYLGEDRGDIKVQFSINTRGNIGQFEVMIYPGDDVEEILDQIMEYVRGFPVVRCLVPEHDVILASSLQNIGFIPVAEYDVLANLSAIRVKEPELMPVRV